MYRYLYSLLICWLLFPSVSFALTEIQDLEQRLVTKGESSETLFKLAEAYFAVGDSETANLYLDYLKASKPEDSWLQKVKVLEKQIAAMKSNDTDYRQIAYQTLILISTGYESNANNGTSLNSLNFRLDSGETFLLKIDQQSQKVSSSYLSTMLIHNRILPWNNIVLSSSIEKTEHTNNLAPDSFLIRSGFKWNNHNLLAFHYDSYETINGVIYSGSIKHLSWLLRYQTDRKIYQLAVPFEVKSKGVQHKLSFSAMRDDPIEMRAGGTTKRYAINYKLQIQNLQLGYKFEKGFDSQPYNAFFFPGIKDQYNWHSINAEYDLGRYQDFNLGLNLKYDDKDSKIDLNSWNGWSAQLMLLRVF